MPNTNSDTTKRFIPDPTDTPKKKSEKKTPKSDGSKNPKGLKKIPKSLKSE